MLTVLQCFNCPVPVLERSLQHLCPAARTAEQEHRHSEARASISQAVTPTRLFLEHLMYATAAELPGAPLRAQGHCEGLPRVFN
jgi:hypothetical protein